MSPQELIPSGDPEVGGYILLMVAGFVLGVFGHIIRSNVLVAAGIAVIFCGVLIFPLVAHWT